VADSNANVTSSSNPKALAAIVEDLVPDTKRPPYGILVGAAADVSAQALSAFHARALELGIAEHHCWSRSVIEDRLYLPENDHLSVCLPSASPFRPGDGSVAATIRAGVTLKKQLPKLLEKDENSEHDRTFLLLRDRRTRAIHGSRRRPSPEGVDGRPPRLATKPWTTLRHRP